VPTVQVSSVPPTHPRQTPKPEKPADDMLAYDEHEPTPEYDEHEPTPEVGREQQQARESYPSSSRQEERLGVHFEDDELEDQGFVRDDDDMELSRGDPGGKAV